MRQHPALGLAAGLLLGVLPGLAMAQSVSVSRSVLENQPYTLIYPDPMVASGGRFSAYSLTVSLTVTGSSSVPVNPASGV